VTEQFISNDDTLQRLARLETKVEEKFCSIKENLVLARDVSKDAKVLARNQLDAHLKGINEFQKRMDKLENTFATKDGVNEKIEGLRTTLDGKINALSILHGQRINTLTKLVYIGVGGALVLELLLRFIIHP